MGHETTRGEPDTLRAGDTWSWKRELTGHPHTDGWSVQYVLAGPSGPLVIEASAVAGTESTYLVDHGPSETADVEAGTYRWIARATKTGEGTFTLDEGVFEVLANFQDQTVGSQQTHAEKVLERIRAAIEGRIDKDQEEITIEGRSIRNIPMLQLTRLEARYAYRVWKEKNPGEPNPQHKVRF